MSVPPSLSPVELAGIGALSGVVEVAIQQPTVSWKNSIQQGRPISFNPMICYRGVFINAASIAPITCTQFGASRAFENLIVDEGQPVSDAVKVASSTCAGVVSAGICTPSELIMIQQQKHGGSLLSTARNLLSTHGFSIFSRGAMPCIAREAVWAPCYLSVVPIFNEKLSNFEIFKGSPYASWATGATLAGLIGATCTQPLDVIKTRMQANLEPGTFNSFIRTAKVVAQDGALFAGLIPRGLRIVGATFILSSTKDVLVNKALQMKATV
ncbi:hypothetical protein CYMTET_14798 [Cymbomonas tetramitiformis]|uniref:Mitochondrial carrier protein n=1 Tax=Cymbomonas tetramitiformis TaxID=36881 RepID=A0AAE0GFV8_9CHLO|nr:hypothetical protein CYMTET_14798 [Cymbomonas tetramitiformis]